MTYSDARQYAPATQRNRAPILEVLRVWLPDAAHVLEIASGTGEHGLYLSKHLSCQWQPSDVDPVAIASIQAWKSVQGGKQFLEPLEINVLQPQWWNTVIEPSVNAIVNINMIHISPWDAAVGLFKGAEALLSAGDVLYLYGPFKQKGIHTAESNAQFDLSLRTRDSNWGVRHLEDVIQLGADYHLTFQEAIAMPANNLSLLFIR